ncbi:MAG: GAF domain-containing protein, partial [Chloroflexi bacterium]|nr:GAF domain-containing protein [Chloroflexota bacterium]
MHKQRLNQTVQNGYSCLVGTAGWAALIFITLNQGIRASPAEIIFFILLSTSSKRLGIKVAQGITYSLVGVIDLAVLYIFGAPAALVVAASSGALNHLLELFSTRPNQPLFILRQAFFGSGLNALMVLASFTLYQLTGGQLPLQVQAWADLAPVLAASACWFIVDHIGWALSRLPTGGFKGALAFLGSIIHLSLLFELLPLPIAVLISTAYLELSLPLFIIISVVFLGVGIITRQLIASLELEQRRGSEEAILGEMGRSFLQTGMELGPICRAIGEYSYRILPAPVYVIQLDCRDWGCEKLPFVLLDGRPNEQASQTFGLANASWFAALAKPLIISDFEKQHLINPLETGAPARSGVYVPILVDAAVVGAVGAQSPEAYAFGEDELRALQLVAAQAALGLRGAHLYRQEQQRSLQLSTIATVSRKVAAILDLDALFNDSVKLIQESFGYYCVNLFTVDQTAQKVRFEASSSQVIQERGIEVPWGGGIIGHAAAQRESVLASDVRQDKRFLPDASLENTHAELAIPMQVEERILGVLDLQSDMVNAFSQQDAIVLQALADQIAIAIEDSRIYQEQQAQAWVSTALLQVAETLAELSTTEDILKSVARLTCMLGGVQCCLIFLWAEEEHVFTAIESAGLTPQQSTALQNQCFEADAIPLLAQVYREAKVTYGQVDDITPYLPPAVGNLEGCGSIVAWPLRAKGSTVGIMVTADAAGEEQLASYRQNILQGIANHTAMALDNARLYADREQEAWVSSALLQVANTITINRSLEDSISTIVHLIPLLSGVNWCAVLLWEEERRSLYVARSNGLPHQVRDVFDGHYFAAELLQFNPTVQTQGRGFALDLSLIEGWQAPGSTTAWALRSPDHLLGLLLVGSLNGQPLNSRRLRIVAGIANQTALAIETYQLYQRTLEQQRLERSMELAHDIQKGFLPESCPRIAGWDIAAEWRAARGVGGDYYDFLQLDMTHTGLVIGDVSDKGIAAALYMVLSRAVVRAAALGMLGPAETLTRANRIL